MGLSAALSSPASLATIRQVAEISEGLSLALIIGPRDHAREGMEQVRRIVGDDREVLWHRLDRQGAALAETLAAARSRRSVLLVHGLERLDATARREVEAGLNLMRDSLARFDALVVLWIPEDRLEGFRRRCPDLFHWRALLVKLTERRPLSTAEQGQQMDRYLHALMASTGFLALSGVDPAVAGGESDAALRLDAVYTSLLTQAPERQSELAGRAPRRSSALEQLNRHHRLVLLGDPGSGKSTFANFVALCLAGERLQDERANLALLTARPPGAEGEDDTPAPAWDHGPVLPVRVMLRDFAARGLPERGERGTAERLWSFVESDLERAGLADYAPYLEQTLRRAGGLILLDGLDEVPEAEGRRAQILESVSDFAASFPQCRILVTCRTYAYQQQRWRLPDFVETVLESFNEAQIRHFVDRWYAHVAELRHLELTGAQGRAELLKAAIFGSDRLRSLAERPLLLTLMASLHAWRGGSLPDQREELYHDAVQLLLDFWERRRVVVDAGGKPIVQQESLTEWLRVDRARVRRLLDELAYRAHASQTDLSGTADLAEHNLVARLMGLSANPDVEPARLIEYLRDRAGLLLARGVGVYTFAHRTFQEYLAACHLTDRDFPELLAELARGDQERWREVALLAGAKAARGSASGPWFLADALCYRDTRDAGRGEDDARGAHLAGLVLAESADLDRVGERQADKLERVRTWQVDLLAGSELPARDRAECGRTVARLGDPRPEVSSIEEMQLCRVPLGPFRMGSETEPRGFGLRETPAGDANLAYDFWIGRFPVTRAQFQAFVEAGGYHVEAYWPEAIEAGAWQGGMLETRDWSGREYRPSRSSAPMEQPWPFSLPNHPAAGVSWFEGRAFCRWLTERLRQRGALAEGWKVDLPNEPEWEKAARGGLEIPAAPLIISARDAGGTGAGDALVENPAPRRSYPWGDQTDAEHGNWLDTGIGTTSAVGCFPRSRSPYGCEEMSGNVWEWTRSQRGEYPYPETPEDRADRERFEKRASRFVLRGGGFGNDVDYVRCAARDGDEPAFRYVYVGFRVVLSPSGL